MKKIKRLLFFVAFFCCISCDTAIENIKEKASKIVEDKKAKVDSTLNKEIENTINKVDTLLNH